MSSYELCTFVGNLTRDAEMKYLPSGTPVTTFTIGVNSQYKDHDGNLVKKVKWVRVSIFGKFAENTVQYLTKGKAVLVAGELSTDDSGNPRVWTDKEGNARATFELRASTMKFLGGGQRADVDESTGEILPSGEMSGGEDIPF